MKLYFKEKRYLKNVFVIIITGIILLSDLDPSLNVIREIAFGVLGYRIIFSIISHIKGRKMLFPKYDKYCQQFKPIKRTFDDEKFIGSLDGDGETYYSRIKIMYVTEDYYFLALKYDNFVTLILSKQRFILGRQEDFGAFIQKKNPDIEYIDLSCNKKQ